MCHQSIEKTGLSRTRGPILENDVMPLSIQSKAYMAPNWLNSVHVNKVDVQLNNAERLITRTRSNLPHLRW
jgi:hypothetical protein